MKNKLNKIQKNALEPTRSKEEPPFLRFVFEEDPKTNKQVLKGVSLSRDVDLSDSDYGKQVQEALIRCIGTADQEISMSLFNLCSKGLSSNKIAERLDLLNKILPTLKPENPLESLLLGQYLSLIDSGGQFLRNSHLNEASTQHKKENTLLSIKLYRVANETLSTLMKVRNEGAQKVQVVHVNQGGQAVIAQDMNHGGQPNNNLE